MYVNDDDEVLYGSTFVTSPLNQAEFYLSTYYDLFTI